MESSKWGGSSNNIHILLTCESNYKKINQSQVGSQGEGYHIESNFVRVGSHMRNWSTYCLPIRHTVFFDVQKIN